MASEEHHRKLERAYLAAPTNQYYKPEVRIGDRVSEITITVDPRFFHAADAVHGSVYFKALDDAAFFAANSIVEDVFVLTASFNIHLMRPISEGQMTATGRLVHATRRSFVAEARLVDADGQLLATGTGTFIRSAIPLDERIGYV
jgi:uncharacterized protein (TIGR00369 family)